MTLMSPVSNEKADADLVSVKRRGLPSAVSRRWATCNRLRCSSTKTCLPIRKSGPLPAPPRAVFRLTPQELQRITSGRVIGVK